MTPPFRGPTVKVSLRMAEKKVAVFYVFEFNCGCRRQILDSMALPFRGPTVKVSLRMAEKKVAVLVFEI